MRHRTRKTIPKQKTRKKSKNYKVYTKHSAKKWYKCIKKINNKQMKKKEFSKVNMIQKKMSYNARLQAPRIVINMNKTILKRKKEMPEMAVSIAKKMISKAEKDIKKNKHKKLKKITPKEMELIKKYQHELVKTVKETC